MPNYRYEMVVGDADRDDALALMSSLGLTGGFSVALDDATEGPATFWGQSVVLTQTQSDGFLGASHPATLSWYKREHKSGNTGKLLATNDPAAQSAVGTVFGFNDALASLGLVRVE